jgi:hypothetical protein
MSPFAGAIDPSDAGLGTEVLTRDCVGGDLRYGMNDKTLCSATSGGTLAHYYTLNAFSTLK